MSMTYLNGTCTLVPHIDSAYCQACEPCQAKLVCKTRAIVQLDPGDTPYIEYSRCSGCAQCVLACVYVAIIMKNSQNPT